MKNMYRLLSLLVLMILFTAITSTAQTLYKQKDQTTIPSNNSPYGTDKAIIERPRIFDKKHSLKVSLLSPFIQTLSVFYTHFIDEESAFQIGASIMNDFTYSDNKYTINSQALTLEYRYLLSGTHDLCTYIQPFIRGIHADSKVSYTTPGYNPVTGSSTSVYTAYSESTFSTGLGFVFGSQVIFKDRILIDVYGGPVYSIQMMRSGNAPLGTYPTSFPSSRATLDDPLVKNYGARGGVSLGFLF